MSMVRKNFTHKRVTPRPVKGLTFTVESKEHKGVTTFYIKDNLGFICGGGHPDAESAEKAIPFIKRNLERGFIPWRWLKRAKKQPTQNLH